MGGSAQAEGNLFKIQHGGLQAWAHGKAFATASATFHRGIEFDLEAELKGSGQATVDVGAVIANLQAGLGIDIASTVAVAFPLDLFSQAGLIARVKLAAEAAAFARLDVNLKLGEFTQRLTAQLPLAWGTLVQTFLEHVQIGAGIFARVGFAAEIVGEAVFVGSLLPGPGGTTSGFTFSSHYAYGYIFGAGAQVVHNFDIDDSSVLLRRLGTELTQIVQAEVSHDLLTLEAADPPLAQVVRASAPYLDLLLPLVSRSLFEVAGHLAATTSVTHPVTVPKQILDSFLAEARSYVMQKALEFALREIHKVLQALAPGIQRLVGTPQQDDALAAIMAARQATTRLFSGSLSSPDQWLDSVLSLLGAFDSFLTSGIVDQGTAAKWQSLTSTVWAGAILLRASIEWQQGASKTISLGDAVKLPPGDTTIAGVVAAAVGRAPTATLTLADMLTYIGNQVSDTAIVKAIPELEKVFAWLKRALSDQSTDNLVVLVSTLTDGLDPTRVQALLTRLGPAITDAVENEIGPHLLARLSSNVQVGQVISEVVEPTLKSLGQVVLPAIAGLGKDDAAVRLREVISSVLLQQMTRLIMESVRLLSAEGLKQATAAAPVLAQEVETEGSRHPLFNELTLGASAILLGTPLTSKDLANLLRLSGSLLGICQTLLPAVLNDIEATISFGLTLGQPQLQQIWGNIGTSNDAPPSKDALLQLFLHSGNLALNVAWQVIQESPQLLADHIGSVVDSIVASIAQAAQIAIRAVEEVVRQLGAELDAIGKEIKQLADAAAALIATLLTDVQALDQRIQGLVDSIVNDIQADGWALISPLVPDFLKGAAQGIYNGIFNDIRWLLDAPLALLKAVAGWIHDALMVAIGTTNTITSDNLIAAVRTQLAQTAATDLSFPIAIPLPFDQKLDLGTITLPGTRVLGRIAAGIVGELQNILGGSGGIVDTANAASSTQRTLAAKQATQATFQNQADAASAVAGMKTGSMPTIQVRSPSEGAVYSNEAVLTVVITGVNPTFLTDVLGVPRRVRLYFNGVEYNYDPAAWHQTATGDQEFTAPLLVAAADLVPRPTLSVSWAAQLTASGTWSVRNPTSLLSGDHSVGAITASPGTIAATLGQSAGTRILTKRPPSRRLLESGAAGTAGSAGAAGLSESTQSGRGAQSTPMAANYSRTSLSGYEMVPSEQLLADVGPPIVLRRGLNTVCVLVAEGDSNNQNNSSAIVHFFFKEAH